MPTGWRNYFSFCHRRRRTGGFTLCSLRDRTSGSGRSVRSGREILQIFLFQGVGVCFLMNAPLIYFKEISAAHFQLDAIRLSGSASVLNVPTRCTIIIVVLTSLCGGCTPS